MSFGKALRFTSVAVLSMSSLIWSFVERSTNSSCPSEITIWPVDSKDSLMLEDVKIDSAFLSQVPQSVRYIKLVSCKIRRDVSFSVFQDLIELRIIDSRSDHIRIDNDSLVVLILDEGRHKKLEIDGLHDGAYIDIFKSGLESLTGLKQVEDRVRFLFFAYNGRQISGLERVLFTELKAYSISPQVATILHDPKKVEYVFNMGGSLDIYKYLYEQGEMDKRVVEYRFVDYASRYLLREGWTIEQTEPHVLPW